MKIVRQIKKHTNKFIMKYCLSITEVMTVDIRMNIDWMKIHPSDPIKLGMGYNTVSASHSENT